MILIKNFERKDMQKIIINIPVEYKFLVIKLYLLLKKTKILLFLSITIYLLIFSKDKKYNISYDKKETLLKVINNTKNDIKVCICTLGKNENRYIKEFVNHYKKLGIDRIFLHDNNNIDNKSESFEEEINEYIKDDFVKVINYRGIVAPQLKIYTQCYKKNNKNYDWFIFVDIDEFIHLQNYSNIKDFLNEERFNKCKLIYFNCLRHTDNDLLFYDNRTLATRFPYINWNSSLFTLKTIARGNIKKIRFHTSHWLDRGIKGCNVFGDVVIPSKSKKLGNDINKPKFKKYYIDHYCFKSTEEYINKVNKGDGIFGFNSTIKMKKINLYFKYNRISLEKINFLEQKTGLNLSLFKLKLNNSLSNLTKKLFRHLDSKINFYIIFYFQVLFFIKEKYI